MSFFLWRLHKIELHIQGISNVSCSMISHCSVPNQQLKFDYYENKRLEINIDMSLKTSNLPVITIEFDI